MKTREAQGARCTTVEEGKHRKVHIQRAVAAAVAQMAEDTDYDACGHPNRMKLAEDLCEKGTRLMHHYTS